MTTTQVQQPPTLVALPSIGPSAHRAPSTDGITVDYLAIVFETVLDRLFPCQGLLLLNDAGQLVQSSPRARQLCSALRSAAAPPSREDLPAAIQRLIQCLIESRELFPGESIQLQDALPLNGTAHLYVQAEWIHLGSHMPPYIIITLENQGQVTHQRARFDAFRYRFTPRETEIWELHLQGFSYRRIADACFITMNTVKRHMKSIHSKRRDDIGVAI